MPTPALESKRRKSVVLLLVAWCLVVLALLPGALHAQLEPTPTPQPFAVQSLFEGDTCAPPCWFGLTPGISRTDDIVSMFRSNANLFLLNPYRADNHLMVQNYELLEAGNSSNFLWMRWARGDQQIRESYLEIQDDVLQWMRIAMNDSVSLAQTLDTFGQPTSVLVNLLIDETYLILKYDDINLIVTFRADHNSCTMSDFPNAHQVASVYYYAHDSFENLVLTQHFDRDFTVPPETWNEWLSGSITRSCLDELSDLIASVSPTTSVIGGSIFDNDTCAPPCWFGLTAGVSTSQEVVFLLETHSDWFVGPDWRALDPETSGQIDRETGYVIDGRYSFNLAVPQTRPDNYLSGSSQIIVEDGKVELILIWVEDYIPLAEVLDTLGSPDLIRFAALDYGKMWMTLIYSDIHLRLLLVSSEGENSCNLMNLTRELWVSQAYYYSPANALAPAILPFIDPAQPALEAYNIFDRAIPLETFETWLQGETSITCLEAWESLPEEQVIPTLLPTFQPTATP